LFFTPCSSQAALSADGPLQKLLEAADKESAGGALSYADAASSLLLLLQVSSVACV